MRWSSPRVRSMMPVSFQGLPRCRSWWCYTPLIDPQYPHAGEVGFISRSLEDRFDVAPYGWSTWCLAAGPDIRWCLPRSVAGGSPSGSPECPDAPWGRTPPRFARRRSPSGRCVHGSQCRIVPPSPRRDPGPGGVNRLLHHPSTTKGDPPPRHPAIDGRF